MATAVPNGGIVHLGELGDARAVLPADARDEDGIALKTLLRETLETVILAVLIFLVIRSIVQNYRIEGQSMEPNFHHGQYLLVNKLAYRLGEHKRGDVIVFHYPNNPTQDYIKRVIGLPGDTIEIRDGVLFLNGLPVDEPYDQITMLRNISAQTVDPGNLYVLGDNRPGLIGYAHVGAAAAGVRYRQGLVCRLARRRGRIGRAPDHRSRGGDGTRAVANPGARTVHFCSTFGTRRPDNSSPPGRSDELPGETE